MSRSLQSCLEMLRPISTQVKWPKYLLTFLSNFLPLAQWTADDIAWDRPASALAQATHNGEIVVIVMSVFLKPSRYVWSSYRTIGLFKSYFHL